MIYQKNCVHEQFEFRTNKNPNSIAIVACDRSLTYQELNSEANRIANALIELGIKPGDIVALKLERNSFLFSAIIGILKVGAAYLPIDPALPISRIEYIFADSNASFCIDNNTIYNLKVNRLILFQLISHKSVLEQYFYIAFQNIANKNYHVAYTTHLTNVLPL